MNIKFSSAQQVYTLSELMKSKSIRIIYRNIFIDKFPCLQHDGQKNDNYSRVEVKFGF